MPNTRSPVVLKVDATSQRVVLDRIYGQAIHDHYGAVSSWG
jgi:hypothetical protein